MSKITLILLSLFVFALRIVNSNVLEDELLNPVNAPPESVETPSDSSKATGSSFRHILDKNHGRRLTNFGQTNRNDVEKLRQYFQSPEGSAAIEWQQFTPPPIIEPNCYVEVQVTQKMPGRCTKLGKKIPACQSQDLVTIDYSSCG